MLPAFHRSLTARSLFQSQRDSAIRMNHLQPTMLDNLLLAVRNQLSEGKISRKRYFNNIHDNFLSLKGRYGITPDTSSQNRKRYIQ
jgi:hypothetical protein